MKKLLLILSFLVSLPVFAIETYTADEIHGTLGLINNTASNFEGALLIIDDRTKTMSILLRSSELVQPLWIFKDGKRIPNPNSFRTRKITSNIFAIKTSDNSIFTDQVGYVTSRKEGMNTYSEITLYSTPKNFNPVWDLYVNSHRIVIEITIDGYPTQLIYTR